jgi:hypothetical protein
MMQGLNRNNKPRIIASVVGEDEELTWEEIAERLEAKGFSGKLTKAAHLRHYGYQNMIPRYLEKVPQKGNRPIRMKRP